MSSAYFPIQPRAGTAETLASGLGWFSIGLGLAELAVPRLLSGSVGMRPRPILLRSYGLREIAAGLGILASRRPTAWLWARVAGDAVDLATLGLALRGGNSRRGSVAIALASVAAVTLLDVVCARAFSREQSRGRIESRL